MQEQRRGKPDDFIINYCLRCAGPLLLSAIAICAALHPSRAGTVRATITPVFHRTSADIAAAGTQLQEDCEASSELFGG